MNSGLERRATLSAVLVGVVGGAVLIGAAELFRWGPAEVLPGIIVLLVAPLLLRFQGLALRLRHLVSANLLASATMVLVLYGYLSLVSPAPTLSWIGHVWRLVVGLGIGGAAGVACALIANVYFAAGARGLRTCAS